MLDHGGRAYFIIMLAFQKFLPKTERMEMAHFKCRQTAFFCLSFSYFPIVKQTLSVLRPLTSPDSRYRPVHDPIVIYFANVCSLGCTYGFGDYSSNHNYNKIVKSDWLSTALISALIGQFKRTVRVMPK